MRGPTLIALTVALLGAAATWYLSLRPPAEALDGRDPRWVLLFAPGAVGMMLVGGVHGGAPVWLMIAAAGTMTGVVWGLVAWVITRIVLRPRDPAAWRE